MLPTEIFWFGCTKQYFQGIVIRLFAVKRVRFCANTICGKTGPFYHKWHLCFCKFKMCHLQFFFKFLICAKTGPIFLQIPFAFICILRFCKFKMCHFFNVFFSFAQKRDHGTRFYANEIKFLIFILFA